MGFRFFRRKKLFPGVTLNLSKSGASLSFGTRGAKVTVGPRGVRKTVGIPGSGLYWTENTSHGRGGRPRREQPIVHPEDRLSLGFFKRLITPQAEEDFVDGMKHYVQGKEAAALRFFRKTIDIADSAFMAGILSLKQERFADANRFLNAAKAKQSRLGQYFAKYEVQATASLSITNEITAIISPDRRGLLLALSEVLQHQRDTSSAIKVLKQLHRLDRDDVVVRLSLSELLLEDSDNRRSWQSVVQLAKGIKNDTEVHAALLLFKARALRNLGLLTAARDTLTATLRKKKGRTESLLLAVRYERALVYEALGQDRRARNDLENLYADAPGYEDVANRLGLT